MTRLKKAWNIISTTVVVLMVLSAVFLMGSRILGYQCYTVISGSMEPKYVVGDLIYVKKVDVNSIKVGDDITFVMNEHFYTKGIANELEDQNPVHFNNVIGVPKFSIPKLGYVSDFIQHSPGMYITIGVVFLLILSVFIPDITAIKGKKELSEADVADQCDDNVTEPAEAEDVSIEETNTEGKLIY